MKTKRFLSCILSLVMLLSMLPATHITVSAAYDWFAGGSGTEADPYLVSTMQQLRAVAAVVNGGDDFSGKYIQLKNDISVQLGSWTPIGNGNHPFRGTFDGNKRKITDIGLRDTSNTATHYGLFGKLEGGTIKNLEVSGTITGHSVVGGIVGDNSGRIENCISNVTVTGSGFYIGGIAGYTPGGTIKNCYNTGSVTGNDSVGGITGNLFVNYTIENCYNRGQITGSTNVGGIAGKGSHYNVKSCYYLNTTASGGINGTNSGNASPKTEDEFKNGSVTYLLQGGQSGYVWGQSLTSYSHDAYPLLDTSVGRKVHKVSFMVKDSSSAGGFREHAAAYGNRANVVYGFPAPPPDTSEYTFYGWAYEKPPYDSSPSLFTSYSKFPDYNAKDITVYAISRESTEGTDADGTISLTQQEQITPIDLNDFVKNKSGAANDFTFTLLSALPSGLQFENGVISGTPQSAGRTTATFKVKNDGFALMSSAYNDETGEITLTLDVGLQGDGTAENPYLILDLSSLTYLRDGTIPSAGSNAINQYAGKHIRLTTDLDLGGSASNRWTPIGSLDHPFMGSFDGQGHKITGLYIDSTQPCQGLFGYLRGEVKISNLCVEGEIANCGSNSGGIAGMLMYVSNGSNYIGPCIENCINNVKITSAADCVGGIAGYSNEADVKSCLNLGNINGTGSYTGAIIGRNVDGATVRNCYYLKTTCKKDIGGGNTYGTDTKSVTAERLASGEIAYELQSGLNTLIWGQTLSGANQDANPILTGDSAKKVYKITLQENPDDLPFYIEYAAVYGNINGTVSLPAHSSDAFLGWSETRNGTKVDSSAFPVTRDQDLYTLWKKNVTFAVRDINHVYKADTPRSITVTPSESTIPAGDISVQYYAVDENAALLASTTPVAQAVTVGKYLYVIDLVGESANDYTIKDKYTVTPGSDRTIPSVIAYDNIGFMYISAAPEQQLPISFAEGNVSLKVGETYTNVLSNGNTVTYQSGNDAVASVDAATGTVTALKPGTATITATSTKEGTTPVYASYTVTVRKELAVSDFAIGTIEKFYDGTVNANVSASVKPESLANSGDVVNVNVTAAYDTADSGDNKTVSYEIVSISGKDADKYILADLRTGTANGKIHKAPVTVICAETTTRTYDGTAQSVDVSAMANGRVFDKANYTVKYNGVDTATEVNSYAITVQLSDEAAKNYTVEPFHAILNIISASQEVFSIEDVPDNVYYGDTFTVSTYGTAGAVTYEITNGGDIASIDPTSGAVTVTGVGRVTVRAKSVLPGHNDRYAVKTFAAKKRVLTPSAAAADRTYNGETGVAVSITLDNTVNHDEITATAAGAMMNADAGDDKIVYVSNITLAGAKKDCYTLSASALQTTISIAPITISGFTIAAEDKKYDGTVSAQASVTAISDVLPADIGQVQITGSAAFDTADSGTDKTVTFTASGLAGSKAANYTLSAAAAAVTADHVTIMPLSVHFVIGQTSFIYDGTEKRITASASDENGRIFNGFAIRYTDASGNDAVPNEAGTYTAAIALGDPTNYTTAQGSVTVTVTAATQDSLVIAGLPGTVRYGDRFELEAVGGAAGGTYDWTVKDNADVTLSFDDENDKAKTRVTVGAVVGQKVEIEVVKKTENYSDVSAKAVLIPAAKEISFQFADLAQTYDGNAKAVTVTPSDQNATYDVTYNGNSNPPVNAGTYTVTVRANGNYTGEQKATLVIGKATPHGDLSDISRSYTYGDSVNATVSGLTAGANATITYAGTGIYVPQQEAPKNAGSYTAILTVSGENYETVTKTQNFVIEKAPLKVWAKNTTRTYGEANPVFEIEYHAADFRYGDTKAVLLAEPIASTTATALSPVGKYNITVSGGSAENYRFVYQNDEDDKGVLEITGAIGGRLIITGAPNTAGVGQTFMLHAFYGNTKVNAAWTSDDPAVAEISADGTVTTLQSGIVTFTATADENYSNAAATFTLKVEKANVNLYAADTVKTYNGAAQSITLVSGNEGFVPILSGADKNVAVTYTLTTDSSVTEPKNAGVYTVSFTVTDPRYSGGGNATLYINKADITVKAKDISKEYGEEPQYALEIVGGDSGAATAEELKQYALFASDGADKKAKVDTYDITVTLTENGDLNRNFTVSGQKGILTVTKAPLTVKVKDVTREYGAENPALEAEYIGFKNEETSDVLTGELVLGYDSSIHAQTPIGEYANTTTASGVDAENYTVTFAQGKVTVTKIGVTASAGAARTGYLTIRFDKPVAGLDIANFAVKNGDEDVTITAATASADNKIYTLSGKFLTSVTYTVTPNLTGTEAENTHEILSGPVSIRPSSGGSGGSGGGGGGGSVTAKSFTVSFETNGGSKIESVSVERNKTVAEPSAPTKDGFTFAGWYTDKALKTAYDFSEKVTKNMTLYAKWTADQTNPGQPTDPNQPTNPDGSAWDNPFTDVTKDDWFYDDVKYVNENGLMNGTKSTIFAPNTPITRAMFVTLLWRAEGKPQTNFAMTFEDIDTDGYYAEAVRWSASEKIVKGYSETEFAPDDKITREQIATIMFRYAQYKGTAPTGAWAIRMDYADLSEISDWAQEAVMYGKLSGMMQGKDNNMFAPKDHTTRAEAAAILHRFMVK